MRSQEAAAGADPFAAGRQDFSWQEIGRAHIKWPGATDPNGECAAAVPVSAFRCVYTVPIAWFCAAGCWLTNAVAIAQISYTRSGKEDYLGFFKRPCISFTVALAAPRVFAGSTLRAEKGGRLINVRHCCSLVFPLPSWRRHAFCLVFPLPFV